MTKKITPQDQELWANFTKDVKRIKRDTVVSSSPKVIKTPENSQLPIPQVKPTQKVVVLHANELRTLRLDGRIDLHGFTQISAEQALREFLKLAVHRNWRWVIAITGKGNADNPSVLRARMPIWLQSMPELVTGYTVSLPKDGGDGAFYVKIRRKLRYK